MQLTEKSILLDQLGAIQDDPSWYVPLSVALDGLNASNADWKPGGRDHSVREIVNHLVFWNERWLQHFNGKTRSDEIDNDATFTNQVQQSKPLNEPEWQTLVLRLNAILSDWCKTLGECTEEQLREPVPNVKFNAPWWAVISNLVTHNVYHIGQIVYVRKLQESWDDSKGFWGCILILILEQTGHICKKQSWVLLYKNSATICRSCVAYGQFCDRVIAV